jgi:hypothetical protein
VQVNQTPAAKKLLARTGSLETRLRLRLTATARKAVTSRRVIVLRRPAKPASSCPAGGSKHPSRQALKERLRIRTARAACTQRR